MVRALHVAVASVRATLATVHAFLTAPGRGRWGYPAVLILLGLALIPLDRDLSRWLRAIPMGGDLRRELNAWQQFGAIGSLVAVGAAVWLLDPHNRRRLLDLAAAALATGGACLLLKMLVGRPRPKFDDPWFVTGPLGLYPKGPGEGMLSPLAFWEKGSADLWSMPSSHSAAAACLGGFLAMLYPALKVPSLVLVAVVAFARVAGSDKGSHWPSDVLVGVGVGLFTVWTVVGGRWASRLIATIPPAQRPGLPARLP